MLRQEVAVIRGERGAGAKGRGGARRKPRQKVGMEDMG